MKRSQSEYTKSNSPIVRSPSPVKKSSLFNSKLAYEFNNCEIFNQNMSKSAFGSLQPTKTDAKAIARDLAAEFTKSDTIACETRSTSCNSADSYLSGKNPFQSEVFTEEELSLKCPSRASNPIIHDSAFKGSCFC
eukprot:CAMPEP_0114579022 /NCGR_PEP_ID=MMETSP0125-20121206/3478_1 /TAXON_ID=485358 ORGANISM="Aristerostoma sp., Strain ATCC 50986" /NCGR_SAMPLE_ID=MMETSP0125 /ASSEMBLY_ACC=CAM_ASM_000245 /LENGTH=134 /DNA_ID=CAMNT_0001769509 /DNA_START=10 /DNA_END=414 /DNA_ORIENTATION=+